MRRTYVFLAIVTGSLFAREAMTPKYQMGKMTDPRDGVTYATTTILGHTWMAENIASLDVVKDGKFDCYDRKNVNCDTLGRLYSWWGALHICPDGWHLPNGDDWKSLLVVTSGLNLLKDGPDSWGFSALMGGVAGKDENGKDMSSGKSEFGAFWSSNAIDVDHAQMLFVKKTGKFIVSNNAGKGVLASVRCIKD